MAETRLGDILRENNIISQLQLAESLQIQKEERGRIGDILVGLGYLTKRQLRYIIKEYKKRIPLGEFMLERGMITAEDLDFALSQKSSGHKPIGQILVDARIISEETLARALSEQLDMPFIIPYQRMIDPRIFLKLPTGFMRHHAILPMSKSDGIITVLVPGLIDESTNMELERVFGPDIELAVSVPSKIRETIETMLQDRRLTEIEDLTGEEELVPVGEIGRKDMSADAFIELGYESRAVELVNYIVSEAMRDGASDIHLEPTPERLQVRFRINGVVVHKADLPLGIRTAVFNRIKALASLNIADSRRVQEGRLMGHLDKMNVDLRVSIFVGIHGEALSMRLYRQESELMNLHDLGFTPNAYSMLRAALDRASGLIVFTGPPGSGKTTTMFAALGYLNDRKLKIVTVEDPVEYIIPGAVQGQLSLHRDATLKDVVLAAVHHDPDVIAIGEVPYGDGARDVLGAALTGHKVLATMHAGDTLGAILRLVDSGLDTFLRSFTGLTIINQRLVRKVCSMCQTPEIPEPRTLAQFPVRDFDPERYDFYHGHGCTHCQNTGFSGRVGLFEVLNLNDEMREAFLAGAHSKDLLAMARASSPFLRINEVAVLKAVRHVTSVDEIFRVAPMQKQEDIKNLLTMEDIERISESSELVD